MINFIHQSRGRIRVRSHIWKGKLDGLCDLIDSLHLLDGMQRVSRNEITGSLVLYFDAERLCPSTILQVFSHRGHLPNVIGFPLLRSQSRAVATFSSAALVVSIFELLLRRTQLRLEGYL